jgi:modulator of FtsH protease HflK
MSAGSSPLSTPRPFGQRLAETTTALARAIRGTAAARFGVRASNNVLMSNGKNDGPPDLDELWRDFNRKLGGLFGNKDNKSPQRRANDGGGGDPKGNGPSFEPDMKSAGIGAGLIALVAALVWLGSGFFIVQEGHQAVVTTFGQYSSTQDAGWKYRWPYPFQAHDTIPVTQLRSVDVGRNTVNAATGLRDSSMLTTDENIVDIRFTVQYSLKDAREFLFENRDADAAVIQAAESAVREIVGRNRIDQVLYEQRDAIAADLSKSVQSQLDRLKAGIVVSNVNVQSVQVPEQVQAAFNDAVSAAADGRRFKNEGQAYASDVIPKAKGAASRLTEQASGYSASIVARASGDADRFKQILTEYQKAPSVTRDRMYLEAMQQVYSNVSKVMVESRSGSNMLYLPLDKLLQSTGAPAAATAAAPTDVATPSAATVPAAADSRSRDGGRSRDRDGR